MKLTELQWIKHELKCKKKKKKKKSACSWIYNHLLKLLFFPLLLTKVHLPWPSKCPTLYLWATNPPSKLCIVLFIFVYLLPHVTMLPSLYSSDCSKGTYSEILHCPCNMKWYSSQSLVLHLLSLPSLLLFSILSSLPPFFLFPFFLFFLPSFLPSSLSFSNLQVLNLDHWTIYAYLDTQSCLTLCNSMDVAHQAPLSMEFARKEYCSGFPFLMPGDIPDSVSFVFCTGRHILNHSVNWEALNYLYCFLIVW